MDDFGFFDDSEANEPLDGRGFSYKDDVGPCTFSAQVTDDLAQEVLNGPLLPISYLYANVDHDEDYKDSSSLAFIKWYQNPVHQKFSRTFAACALEGRHNDRENYTGSFHLSNFTKEFNRSGMKIVDTDYECKAMIPQHAAPRIARMYNVWYRETYTADGLNLFATSAFPVRKYRCPACGTLSFHNHIVKYGEVWLRLTQGAKDD